tara:strand:- start:2920 stop:3144 length:225 start_codon:yes stop_codon:yes gene_type:complete
VVALLPSAVALFVLHVEQVSGVLHEPTVADDFSIPSAEKRVAAPESDAVMEVQSVHPSGDFRHPSGVIEHTDWD